MSVSIIEALQNAEINLVKNSNFAFAKSIGADQLRNAIVLLEKGYGIHDEVDPLLEAHGDVENVPDKS